MVVPLAGWGPLEMARGYLLLSYLIYARACHGRRLRHWHDTAAIG